MHFARRTDRKRPAFRRSPYNQAFRGVVDRMFGNGIGRQQAQNALAGLAMLGGARRCVIFNGVLRAGNGAERAGEGHRQHHTKKTGECYRHAQLQ